MNDLTKRIKSDTAFRILRADLRLPKNRDDLLVLKSLFRELSLTLFG